MNGLNRRTLQYAVDGRFGWQITAALVVFWWIHLCSSVVGVPQSQLVAFLLPCSSQIDINIFGHFPDITNPIDLGPNINWVPVSATTREFLRSPGLNNHPKKSNWHKVNSTIQLNCKGPRNEKGANPCPTNIFEFPPFFFRFPRRGPQPLTFRFRFSKIIFIVFDHHQSIKCWQKRDRTTSPNSETLWPLSRSIMRNRASIRFQYWQGKFPQSRISKTMCFRVAEILEWASQEYFSHNPDPLDSRHPLKVLPDCALGHILRYLHRSTDFFDKVTWVLHGSYWDGI